ncbi:MAG: thioredoxin, partial [Candidatus Omnitrophica bacterium]|nr:thioredoxin [Candidatus Omnitrophota bacterium]
MQVSLFVAFGAGVVSFFSPCVLPLLPAYISFITGVSLDKLRESDSASKRVKGVLRQTVLFVLGFSFIFICLGASASFLGNFIFANKDTIRVIGGIVMIVFGLHIAGVFNIKYLQYEKKLRLSRKPANIFGAFVIGMVFAVGWTPCVGPILGSILAYAAMEDTVNQGIILLSLYSLGLGLPFLLTAVAVTTFLNLFSKVKKIFRVISIASGLLLIVVGILMITGSLRLGTKNKGLNVAAEEAPQKRRLEKMEIEVNDANFKQEVLESELPCLVDFWAVWCGPCQMIAPALEEIAKEYKGKLKVCKLNVDEAPDISSEYQIMSIPNLVIFKNGKKVDSIVGAVPKEAIIEKIKLYID